MYTCIILPSDILNCKYGMLCSCFVSHVTYMVFSIQFFEVLAKITLYQKAATTYHLQSDAAVKHWLTNLQTYSDRERYVMERECMHECHVYYASRDARTHTTHTNQYSTAL